MKIGDTNEIKKIVTDELTATAAGSGALRVFGTPYLAAMMENAALEYIARDLPEGKSTVGVKVSVEHTAPTPVGMEVTVRVRVTDISANGKLIDFKMEAFDEAGPIGTGRHQRAVIDIERFMGKCYGKLK
ncbi:MAG: thioesterase family protein [Lachnospiraceae bacterium]|nr:thioesterase family protein [Lachnospiraceae bacterium]